MTPSLLLAVLLIASTEGDDLRRFEDYAGRASAYSVWAGLPLISESPSFSEVRVWRSISILGLVTGWVVTDREIRIYSNHRVIHGVTHADDSAMRLVSTKRLRRASAILEAFQEFAELNGEGVICPVKDGASILVEGKRGDATFALLAGNPGRCDIPHSREISRTFKRLQRVAGDAL